MKEFVHLRLHTEFSLIDGLVRIPTLMGEVAAQGMPAVAVTDATNFYGLIKAYKAAQRAGLKLIVGVICGWRTLTSATAPNLYRCWP